MDSLDIHADVQMVDTVATGLLSSLIIIYPHPQFMEYHSHSYIQISYVTKGQVEFIVGQEHYSADQGEAVFINSNSIHMSQVLENGSSYICFNMKPDLLLSFLSNVVDGHHYVIDFLQHPNISAFTIKPDVPWQKEILNLLKKITQLYTKRDFAYQLNMAAHLLTIWSILIRENREKIQETGKEESIDQIRIKTALQYIDKHYEEKISLEDVAKLLHISREEVCRLFKRTLQTTCFNAICNCRIIKSVELLCFTEKPVGEIAMACGFESFSYYIKRFKERIGCSPTEYRTISKKSNQQID